MNKNDYIKEVGELHASDGLKDKISQSTFDKPKKSVNRKKRIMTVIAACLAVVLVGGAILSIGDSDLKMLGSNISNSVSENGEKGYSESSSDDSGSGVASSGLTTYTDVSSDSRKIIKHASVNIETKNSEELIKKINDNVKSANGYVSSLEENNYNEYRRISTTVNVPPEKLDEFLVFLGENGTITEKSVVTSDITDSYTETESKIKAYETEEKALLGILEKCDNVQDTITVQNRLSEVRSELEAMKSQKEQYDSQISYSEVTISVVQVERESKTVKGFGAEVSEKFSESLYNLGQFFRNLAVFLLGASPYLLVLAAVIAIAVIIIKRKRKSK
ncbi:MAG: DUF4349 domain-containing protein [Acutalibacteraceae bacterium]